MASRCTDYAFPAHIHLLQHTKSDRKSPKVVTKEEEAIYYLRRHDETSSGAIGLYPGGTAVQGKAAAASRGTLRYTFMKFQEVWSGDGSEGKKFR